jgi:proline iminopeptidase
MSNAPFSAATWQEGNIDNVNAAMRQQGPERWERILALREQGVKSLDSGYQELYGELLEDLEWVDPYGHPRLQRDPADRFRAEVYAQIVGDDPEWAVSGTLTGYDPLPRMATLRVATLVVCGRWDRLTTPALAIATCRALPAADTELVFMERSAHRPWVEEPDAYFSTLGRFLDDKSK